MKSKALITVLLLAMLLIPTHVSADSFTFYAAEDNYMREESPDDNQGTQTDLQVGYVGGSWEKYRPLVEFNVVWGTDIPTDATVTGAVLSLYYYDGSGNQAGLAIYVRRLLRLDWSETESCWNDYKTGSTWSSPGASTSNYDFTYTGQVVATTPSGGGGVWMNWNILSQVQWAQTNDVNVAVLICSNPEYGGSEDRSVFFRSREYPGTEYDPKLVLTYSLPVPAVLTLAATNVGGDTALLNGLVTSGEPLTQRGFQYGLTKTATWDAYETGTFGTGTYSQTISGLLLNTTYWFRAYAVNDIGTTYDSWVSFETLDLPTVTTDAATYVGSTSVRFNGRLTNDGGEGCEYRFQYGYASGTYVFETDWANSISTGQSFYSDISDLVSDTTYYFRAQARNSAGVGNGAERSFTTSWALLAPSQFSAHATSGAEISLLWIKGGGSGNTLIRMKTNSYPTTVDEGTQVYFSSGSSISVTGLSPGTSYYFSAWGESSGDYSAESAHAMTTTFAGSPVTEPTNPGEPSGWFQIPSTARITGMPFYDWVNRGFDKYELPHVTGWVLLALLFSALAGIGVLAIFPRDPTGGVSAGAVYAGLIASGLVIVGARWMGVLPFWLILIPITIGGSYAFVKSRA